MALSTLLPIVVTLLSIKIIQTETVLPTVQQSEPACYSRFDYESKMLERIVMVEHRMNLLESSTKQAFVDLTNEKDSMVKEMKDTLKLLTSQQDENLAEMDTFMKTQMDALRDEQETQLASLSETGIELQNTSQYLVEQQHSFQNQLKEKVNDFTANARETLYETTLDTVNNVSTFYTGIEEKYTLKVEELSVIQKTLQTVADELVSEQNIKLDAIELIGNEIKRDIQERILKLEQYDENQDIKYRRVLIEFDQMVNSTWMEIQKNGFGIDIPVVFHVTEPDEYPGDIVIFNQEVINTNSVYNAKDGFFTAPAKGVYIFSVQMCGFKGIDVSFRIYAGSKVLAESSMYDYDTAKSCVSANAMTVLEQGEQVCVKQGENMLRINNNGPGAPAFMGALVN